MHTVLLVDDNPDTSAIYTKSLAAAGFVVTTAGTGRAAVSAIKHNLPEIVIVDWQMPDMRGDELLELLAHDGDASNLPVLILSNLPPDDPQIAGAMAAGQTIGWLVKSSTVAQDLADQLKSALDGNPRPTPSVSYPRVDGISGG